MVRFWLVKYKVLYSLTKCFCAYDWHKDTTIFLILYVFSLIFFARKCVAGNNRVAWYGLPEVADVADLAGLLVDGYVVLADCACF